MANNPSEVVTGARRIFSVPSIYRLAQSAIGADKVRDFLVDEVLHLTPGERVLDIGCGPADILEYLPDVDYVGFDHSASYIGAAQARFGERGQFINTAAGDIDLAPFAPRDIAMSIGVLHHLNDDEVRGALETARAVIGTTGRFVSLDPTFAEGQHAVGRFLASRDRGQHVRTPKETEQLVREVFENVSVSARHDLLRVPYSHVLVEARSV